jgi:ABC-type Na+ transport system ATPase subunit NatA
MLAGLIAPTNGSVTIDRIALTRATGSMVRTRVGFSRKRPAYGIG